ncbi:N-acetylglucosamine-6-phosphate deacetylase [Viridibacillus sp. NPDC093762]|uniref:N-acetylglucosamine-6-phosphate deacetylase n=1 Tax=Viridibacillus sp. NPDC093762 TaxID=3390720 RepID=UPI003D054383
MSETILISNVTIVNYDQEAYVGDLYLEEGKITKVGKGLSIQAQHTIDGTAKRWIVFPGFIDMHIHGSAGFDVMDATKEAMRGIAHSLPKEGTTGFLATTMTQSVDAIEATLKNAATYKGTLEEAEMLGIHVEGPYISKERAGAQPLQYIIEPSIEQFHHWQELSKGRIKQVTVAPEVNNGFGFIEEISKEGIVVSLGHSDAMSDEIERAVGLGAKQATHLYNQMRPFHHREPGVVGDVLLEDDLKVEIIADFIHSHPKSVKFAYRLKGASRIILITDAMRAKGLDYGVYDLGGQAVHVTEKGAHLSDGTLAGSVLTMEQAVKNIHAVTKCTLQELVAMSSKNAADQLELPFKGYIGNGMDADLVILDEDLNVQKTICRGKVVYEKETQ